MHSSIWLLPFVHMYRVVEHESFVYRRSFLQVQLCCSQYIPGNQHHPVDSVAFNSSYSGNCACIHTCMAFLLHILLSQTQSLKTIHTYVWMTADNTRHDCTFITASNERVYTVHAMCVCDSATCLDVRISALRKLIHCYNYVHTNIKL